MTTPPWCREKVMVYYYYYTYSTLGSLFAYAATIYIIIIVKFMAKPNLINRLVLSKAKNTENTSEIVTKIFFTGDLGFGDFNKQSKDFRRSVVLTCARKQIVHFANSTIKTVFPTS